MNGLTWDIPTIQKRLDILESEIQRLRHLLAPDRSANHYPDVNHPYVESVADILRGEPVITGTRTPVRAVVEYWKFGVAPEEIAERLPHLRLAQIFDALAYYDDHRDQIEHYIALNRVPVDE